MFYEMSPESLIISDLQSHGHSDENVIAKEEQITLTWKNVTVMTQGPKSSEGGPAHDVEMHEMKTILSRVSGIAEPGQFLAIMGSSGAGKTTLLNVLTGRSAKQLHIEGTILANGKAISESFKKVSAYVQQHGLFLGTLTVKEHLMFQATLRIDRHVTKDERIKLVENIIEQVGLGKCVNTMIGLPGRPALSLSGGEERRLSMASELLTRPSVLFCDEPTSGLDSYMAASVVTSLKELAAKGHTVICTIHQPSSNVCAMFDKVLLMASGRCAFLGSVNATLRFFKDIGYECPSTYCPTDYLLGMLAVRSGDEDNSKAKIKKICDAFQNSPISSPLNRRLTEWV
ncbi:protein white-like [Ptychodera flava]|uniref:protein white-like n=1 Tax=Ptychodera flava TaxID=63121 RepID=UPI00396A6EC6